MSTPRKVLITGGAGFIGTNLADRLLCQGREVILFDDLSRVGVQRNADWLLKKHGERVSLVVGDVRDAEATASAVSRAAEVYHLAAQVAVTTSLRDPVRDFEINARGTLNLLEAIRTQAIPPPLLFTSTNKVYGELDDVELVEGTNRCSPADNHIRRNGIDESRPLDFRSPYGCSKGTADQYVLDYARHFGLRAAVFRMSCIYGPHQQGNEDQGWVAHFLIRGHERRPVTVFGDGRQVRDVLFIDDLVDAFTLAMKDIGRLSGRAFNIGGGSMNTLSLLELLAWQQRHEDTAPEVHLAPARAGDQRYYVSDISAFATATGWHPQVSVTEGLDRLSHWVAAEDHYAARGSRVHEVQTPAAAASSTMEAIR